MLQYPFSGKYFKTYRIRNCHLGEIWTVFDLLSGWSIKAASIGVKQICLLYLTHRNKKLRMHMGTGFLTITMLIMSLYIRPGGAPPRISSLRLAPPMTTDCRVASSAAAGVGHIPPPREIRRVCDQMEMAGRASLGAPNPGGRPDVAVWVVG